MLLMRICLIVGGLLLLALPAEAATVTVYSGSQCSQELAGHPLEVVKCIEHFLASSAPFVAEFADPSFWDQPIADWVRWGAAVQVFAAVIGLFLIATNRRLPTGKKSGWALFVALSGVIGLVAYLVAAPDAPAEGGQRRGSAA